MWWRRGLRLREVRSGECAGPSSWNPTLQGRRGTPGIPGWKGPLPGPRFPRVLAADPPSRTVGAAGARLTSLRALLLPRPLPTAPPEVQGARASTRPLLSGTGAGELGVSFVPEGEWRPPSCPSGQGWRLSGRSYCRIVKFWRVCVALLTYASSPTCFHLLVPSRALGANDPLSSPFPVSAFFCRESTCFANTVLFQCVFSASSFSEGCPVNSFRVTEEK